MHNFLVMKCALGVITWDYDPLFAAVLNDNESLRGYYLHRAHLKMCATIKKYIISRTSKPVSRLIKASCNLLLADEIRSITVPINVRCSSEIIALSSRSLSASDRIPDGVGFFWLLSSRAGHFKSRTLRTSGN